MPFKDPDKKRAWNRAHPQANSEYKRRWEQRHPERAREAKRRQNDKVRAARIAQNLLVYGRETKPRPSLSLHPSQRKEKNYLRHKKRQHREDTEALTLLGGRCICIEPIGCAGADLDVIEIDHVNGDGKFERQKATNRTAIGRRGGRVMIEFRKHGLEHVLRKYQLLCANCHRRKTKRNRDHLPRTPPEQVCDALPLFAGPFGSESIG